MTAVFDDFTEHKMPSGAVCFYKDHDHSYWEGRKAKKKSAPDGEWSGSGRLTGVTTVVSPFDWQPNNLMAWAVRINLEGVAQLVERESDEDEQGNAIVGASWLTDAGRIKERLRVASLTDEDVRDAAGDRGTNVHLHTLNAMAAGAQIPSYDELTDVERGYAGGVVQFWLDHSPETLQAEQVVCDLGLRVAGRLDFRGMLGSRCDDKLCPCQGINRKSIVILDLKTGGYINAPAHVQVAGYDHNARVSGFGPSERRLILKVKEDGTYQLIESHATREDFLTAIEIYRRAAEINKAANKDRKAREEA
jgi:hypothetical protein